MTPTAHDLSLKFLMGGGVGWGGGRFSKYRYATLPDSNGINVRKQCTQGQNKQTPSYGYVSGIPAEGLSTMQFSGSGKYLKQ